MLGKTHIPAGITAAILMTQPTNALELASAVSGGAVGGWICDIDCLNSSRKEGAVFGGVLALILSAATLWYDSLNGGALINYLMTSSGKRMLTGAAIMLFCCIFGYISSHRTFTHSVLGLVLMSQAMALICPPVAPAFSVGAASHILLDLFNKKDVHLLYPLPKGFCLGVCSSDGKANHALTALFTTSATVLIAFYSHLAVNSGIQAVRDSGMLSFIRPQLESILIFMNAAALIVSISEILFKKRRKSSDDNLTLALCALGGGAGTLVSYVVLILFGKFRKPVCWLAGLASAVFWGSVLILADDPFGKQPSEEYTSGVLIWFAAVNIISALSAFFSRRRKVKKLRHITGIVGGGAGALLGLTLNGKKVSERDIPAVPMLISAAIAAVAVILM